MKNLKCLLILSFCCLIKILWAQSLSPNAGSVLKPGNKNIILSSPVNMESQWYTLPGNMKQIAAQAKYLWGINLTPHGKDYEVCYFTENRIWQYMKMNAVKVTVTINGDPWIINAKHEIYKGKFIPENHGNAAKVNWEKMPGNASDIDACFDGVFIITTRPIQNTADYTIARWSNNNWIELPEGGGTKIAVDQKYQPWIVNSKNELYQKTEAGWKLHTKKVLDIDIDQNGNVFILDISSPVSNSGFPVCALNPIHNPQLWQGIGGEFIQVAATAEKIIVVNRANQVFEKFHKAYPQSTSREVTIDKPFIYSICPKGQDYLDYYGAPEMNIVLKWQLSEDSSQVLLETFVTFYNKVRSGTIPFGPRTDIDVIAHGYQLTALGEPAPLGYKYTHASFSNNNKRSVEMKFKLKNTGFNEVTDGCDGKEEIIDASEILTVDRGRSIIDEIKAIGDTGGNDVSTDDDCNCDSRINSMRLRPIKLTMVPR